MFSSLKNHPFAVEAHFEQSIVLTFAFPKEQLERLLPDCLSLDTFDDKWAFMAIALVKTKDLRPKGFPKVFGNDFVLIVYRIFVRYTNNAGKRLRGLYILKSETDKKIMEILGNMFTHYSYTTTDISQQKKGDNLKITSIQSDFFIHLALAENFVDLPDNSPFVDWKEARRYAGPLPFTFSYNAQTKQVLTIEGVRENWIPRPISVLDYSISFFCKLGLNNGILANAFAIDNIPYYWKRGKIEQWIN
jgi:uncharacterized protein YqjF (DUF2071 family)